MATAPPVTVPTPPAQARAGRARSILFGSALGLAVGAVATWAALRPTDPDPISAVASAADDAADDESSEPGVVSLPESARAAAGLSVAPAVAAPLAEAVRVTGKVALNEDRLAHVYPLVEGRVEEVRVRFGQRVKAGEVLAIIQSKEVGQRKLELVQSRLARDAARLARDRAAEVERNALDLIAALERGASAEEVEAAFKGRSVGAYRERLVTAQAALVRATADHDRLADLTGRGVTAAKDLTAATADRDAARATLTALLEQSKFDVRQEALAAAQALREAEARVAAGEAALAILGYAPENLREIDPAKEGEALSHYPVVAPFDGTVLTKDAVLLESVGPDRQLFEVADLSTVWVVADVYERHVPLLDALAGRAVAVRGETVPGVAAEATVFFTGETVEEETRTVRLRAAAKNPDGRLKPGMFVEVELPGATSGPVVQVPEAALAEHAGRTFVFVRADGDAFERRDVVAGRRTGGAVEIVEGLKAGEPVAVGGVFALKSRLLADLLAGD